MLFERVLQRQRVDHGGQHAHVIGGDAVHAAGRGGHAAKEVAAAHHHADLNAGCRHFGDFARQRSHPLRIDAEGGRAGQHFAAQLEQNALVARPSRYSAAAGFARRIPPPAYRPL